MAKFEASPKLKVCTAAEKNTSNISLKTLIFSLKG